MYDRPVLDVEDALKLMDAALAAAPEVTKQPIVVSVVDDNGDWVAFARMDGAPAFSREYAQRKAYTASLMRRDLTELAASRQRTGRLITDYGNPRLVGAASGGVVLKDGAGNVLGGLGVSGGTPEEDEQIARTALSSAPVLAAGGAG
jgi:uncharacterized protein GlcG (DUF336 family)